MGTGLFELIAQGCQSLAATAAPSVTAMGVHIVLALATIMLVWFGVQEALASAHGGPGFSMGRFLNLFMLLTFAYVMVNYYDSSIPGLGFSIKGFIDSGTINLVNLIGSDGSNTIRDVEHSIEVTAETLYEAIATALAALQQDNWVGEIGQGFATVP